MSAGRPATVLVALQQAVPEGGEEFPAAAVATVEGVQETAAM